MKSGRLYYAMEEATVGKDSVLGWVRENGPSCGVICAHHYVACAASEASEHQLALSAAEFERRERRGLFALTWQARGMRYGLGKEIELWLGKGIDVLIDGSRAALPLARAYFSDMVPVLIAAGAGSSALPVSGESLPEGTLTIANGLSTPELGAALLSAIRHAG
ncbi:MAG: hypothetical protein JO278_03070 [Dyella sp.]|nr:hypothetical protein [Dyella sp.]